MSERTEHGFRIGAIEAVAMAEIRGIGSAEFRVGDTRITVEATPKGRRIYVTIDDGKADVVIARRRDGRWE